ncbi:MAG: RagB/SusD family nutrient uptake outer membrane protein [Gelidibacter sp.]|nr:RagB/SusD family nutrient uptake outer membrane protein [Gelidibacter sp.]
MKEIKIIAWLLLGVFATSCTSDFLEPAPESGITSGSYYSNETELLAAVINMYDGLQGVNSTNVNVNRSTMDEFYLTEMRSDNTESKSQEGESAQFEFYTITPQNSVVSDYYASFYNVIYRANVVLQNLGVVKDPNVAAKFEAEAKFVRAHAYFNLVRLFGDIPFVDRVISPLETEIQYTRVATSSIYELIESDLATAISGLDNTYRTRASKAAAQAILAKVYLTQRKNYIEAQTLLESVMGSGYSLQTNFHNIFYTEANKEVIFAIGYTPNLSSDSQDFSAEWLNAVGRTSGVNYVTVNAKVALDTYGGNRTVDSYRIDPLQITKFQVTKYLPDGQTGGANGKTFVGDPQSSGNDWIVLRYADVLLMHVEAIMAGATSTTSGTALNSFQLVRNRAGLTTPVTSISKADLLLERRVELAFENQRFFDLVRFGEAQAVLGAHATATGGTFTDNDLLLPIPQNEINSSKGLMQQNPGY